MERSIKAIPTEYNGVQYRSRTEARWAIFFDLLSVNVKYESVKVQTGISNYVPDFILPKQRIIFEVKGTDPTDLEKERLSKLTLSGAEEFDTNLVISSGGPGSKLLSADKYGLSFSDTTFYFSQCAFCGEFGLFYEADGDGDYKDVALRPIHHDECRVAREMAREFDIDYYFYDGYGDCPTKPHRKSVISPMVEMAIQAARSICFDSPNFHEIINIHITHLEVLRDQRVFCSTIFIHDLYYYFLSNRKNDACPRFDRFNRDPVNGEEDKRFFIIRSVDLEKRLPEGGNPIDEVVPRNA